MSKSAAAIREFAEKWGYLPDVYKYEPEDAGVTITMGTWHRDKEGCLSDLTALISEHYYPKEFTEWLLKQDSYPLDNGGTYFLVNGVAGDDAALLFYHWNKYIKKENEQ